MTVTAALTSLGVQWIFRFALGVMAMGFTAAIIYAGVSLIRRLVNS